MEALASAAFVGRACELGELDRALGAARTGSGATVMVAGELALWERRWADADKAIREDVARLRSRDTAQIRVWLCAKGLRAQAELAALARARRDADAALHWPAQARKLIAVARRAAADASAVTPNAAGWPPEAKSPDRQRVWTILSV